MVSIVSFSREENNLMTLISLLKIKSNKGIIISIINVKIPIEIKVVSFKTAYLS